MSNKFETPAAREARRERNERNEKSILIRHKALRDHPITCTCKPCVERRK